MTQYSKMNIVYLLQKWMDSVPGQTFLNYAYSWGAAVVILGTLFKLTHLPGANVMLFIGMGTEVVVFFISAFDRPFDKTTIDMTLDNHVVEDEASTATAPQVAPTPVAPVAQQVTTSAPAAQYSPANSGLPSGSTIIIGNGIPASDEEPAAVPVGTNVAPAVTPSAAAAVTPNVTTPAPAVSQETAEAMEVATTSYVDHLNELNEMLEKVAAQSARLATDSEEMENLNRTLTGISRVYEMQLKSASQQITTQDAINEQTKRMAEQIKELNAIYTRMIEAMTVNMPGAQPKI